MLIKYLENQEDIVISGISSSDSGIDKIFEILRIDGVILLSCNKDFISNCLKKITCTNVILIIPDKVQIRTGIQYPHLNIQTIAFSQTLITLPEKLHSHLYNNQKNNTGDKQNYNSLISKREREILQLILKGKKNREIADELFLSIKTIENHRNNILKKTKAKSMLSLVNNLMNIGYLK